LELDNCIKSIRLQFLFHFMLSRTGWMGAPKLSLSTGGGNPRYAIALSVVCFLQMLSRLLLQHVTVDNNAV